MLLQFLPRPYVDTFRNVFLDELDPDAGNYEAEPALECGLLCGVQEELF